MSLVIDAHQHFWDPARADYPWMQGDEMAVIRRAFGPSDLAPLLAENGVDASIVVQCRSSLEETEEFLQTAAATPSVVGVVGWADLTDPSLGDCLARLRALPGGKKLIGIRHQVHDEADPDWLMRSSVQRGLAYVFAHDLTYDLLVRTRELPAAIAAARAFPKAGLCSTTPPSHRLPKASAKCGRIAWRSLPPAAMSGARFPASPPRLSGMIGTRRVCFPVIAHAAKCFGEDRLIFGSDWPVCLLAGSYGAIKRAFDECVAKLGPGFHDKALGANARAAYRLPV